DAASRHSAARPVRSGGADFRPRLVPLRRETRHVHADPHDGRSASERVLLAAASLLFLAEHLPAAGPYQPAVGATVRDELGVSAGDPPGLSERRADSSRLRESNAAGQAAL